jgi:MFS family permease
VPLRSRAKYLGVLLGVAGIAMPVGPVIGGAIAEGNWRWIFYLNVPFAALAIGSVVFLMNITYKRSPTWKHAVARVDFLGSAIFIPSIVSVTYGLVSGGVVHPWGSYKVRFSHIRGTGGSKLL